MIEIEFLRKSDGQICLTNMYSQNEKHRRNFATFISTQRLSSFATGWDVSTYLHKICLELQGPRKGFHMKGVKFFFMVNFDFEVSPLKNTFFAIFIQYLKLVITISLKVRLRWATFWSIFYSLSIVFSYQDAEINICLCAQSTVRE